MLGQEREELEKDPYAVGGAVLANLSGSGQSRAFLIFALQALHATCLVVDMRRDP